MRRLLSALLLVGCASPHPPTTPAIDRKPDASQLALDAYSRYRSGLDAEGSPEGKAAFRAECLAHLTERELDLDLLSTRVQVHAFAWHEWYSAHCTAVQDVVDRETGTPIDAMVCDPDAGAPPARRYAQSEEEVLARARRDACERAQ